MPLNARSWKRFFQQEIIIRQRQEEGLYRERVLTNGVDIRYAARVERMRHNVRSAGGEEIVADGVVFLMEVPPVQIGDQLVLPDGDTPLVLAIESPEEIGRDAPWYLSLHYGRDTSLSGAA